MSSSNTTIQLRKSGETGNTPVDLQYGELALNYADGKLFYKNAIGEIRYISTGGATDSFTTVNANSTLILATSPTDILGILPGNNISITGNSTDKNLTVSLVSDPTVTSLYVGNLSQITSSAVTTVGLGEVTVDSFDITQIRSAKYYAQMSSGSNYHLLELRVLQDGTSVFVAQYGEILNNVSLGYFDAEIVGSTLNLLFTPSQSTTTISLVRNAMSI
jgi:hypothetical protein